MPSGISRAQVLAFRLGRHHLSSRLTQARLADAVRACSVCNSPPGSAVLALMARVSGVSDQLVTATLSARTTIEVLGSRMRPALVHRDDVAVFTVGGVSLDDASLRVAIGSGPSAKLAAEGIRPADALSRAIEATRQELAGGARGRGELSAALTARLPDSMSSWCARCRSRHVYETIFRLPGVVGVTCIAVRTSREVSYVLTDEWLGRRVPDAGSSAAKEAGQQLARCFLRCYAPTTPEHFADWAKIGIGDARRRFAELAGELCEVRWGDGTAVALRADVTDLQHAELPAGVCLLPPNDPYLLTRDRETIVPDPALRKLVWPASGSPGVVVADGEIVGIWRAQKKNTTLHMQVSTLRPLAKSTARLLQEEYELQSLSRACDPTDVAVRLIA
jgi:hypothetical protein